jgi:predicted nucleotidyltransferase
MNEQLTIPKERLAAFCRRWNITELALFGSALREDFGPKSDVDVLVSFAQDANYTLFDLARIEAELAGILDREVDLVDRAAVEHSRNYIRRKAILSSLELIYAA